MIKKDKNKDYLAFRSAKVVFLLLNYCHGSIIIFFRHLNGRCLSCCGYSSCGCCLILSCDHRLSLILNGCHYYSCCHCVLNSKRNFWVWSGCFCCSCRLTSYCSMSWVYCNCRYLFPMMKDAVRKNLVDVHTRSWSARDDWCWVRCSFGAGCFGCLCSRCWRDEL